jgi:proline iminopeptidase
MKTPALIPARSAKLLLFAPAVVLLNAISFSQTRTMSPAPPQPALSSSIAPQPTLLPPAPPGQPMKQGYLKGKDGVQLFYRVVGTGKDTIVFCHGGPGGGMDDGGLDIEFIAEKGYTFIEYDQRGGARSELVRDTNKLTVTDHVMDLDALRQFFNLQEISLIGLSWGSRLIAEYHYRFPQHVKRLVFLSPGPIVSGSRRRIAQDSALGPERRKHLDEISKKFETASDKDLPSLLRERRSVFGVVYVADSTHLGRERGSAADYSPAAIRNFSLHAFRRYYGDPPWDLRYLLKKINVPAIVIEGEKTIVPRVDTQEWVNNIQGAKLILIPGAGHQNWLDNPDVLINELDNFFKSTRNN